MARTSSRKNTKKNTTKKVEEVVETTNTVENEKTETVEQEQTEAKVETTVEQEQKATVEQNKVVENKTESVQPTEPKKLAAMDPESVTYVKENLKRIDSAEKAYELFKENGKVKDLVIGLKHYKDFITGPKKDQPLEYVSASYRLYNLVLKQLNEEKYSLFKLRLDILLKVMLGEQDKQMNLINLLKFDHYWKYGQKTRISYYLLMTFLEGVANPKTRKAELKRMSIDKLADYLPEKIIINFRRYFNV